MKKQTTKSKVRRIFDLYRADLITLGMVIAELEKIHSETILERFKEKLNLEDIKENAD